jgi:DNA-binding LacI/PurR family transcriptional regulator
MRGEKMSITIKDIAKIANVSHTTVSRALNNSPLINDETKSKIHAIAKQLNYVPNYNAKSLVLDKSYNIGLFFSTIKDGTSPSFFYETVRGANTVIKDTYNLVVRGIDDYKDFHSVNKKSFDGIIVMSQTVKDNTFIYHILNAEIPTVVINRPFTENFVVNIISDDREGAYRVVKHLVDSGHKDIAIIEGKEGFRSTEERKEGYLQALIDHSILPKNEYIIKGHYDIESGYEAMKQLLILKQCPTAVFCSNDDMALGAYKAIYEFGKKVPEDISVVGFDDNVFSKYITPTLTTVKRPMERISEEGARILLEMVESKKRIQNTIYMNTDVIIRDSIKSI